MIPWNTINKPPSAELRPDQKDQDSLPEYEILDGILEGYVEMQLSVDEIISEGYEEEVVKWVARAVDINEWKRFVLFVDAQMQSCSDLAKLGM